MIGIDIVDLRNNEAPRSQHVHYLRRVASSTEQSWVQGSSRPDLALAVLWAAKEATYKALSRRDAEEPFVPAEVSVLWEERRLEGTCTWRGRSARVQGDLRSDHACAIALHTPTSSCVWASSRFCGKGLLAPAEESMAARRLASGLLTLAGYPNAEIRRAANGKPWIAGTDRVTVSLSHDGYWAAAAIAVESAVSGEAA